jgi:hypothetical protein
MVILSLKFLHAPCSYFSLMDLNETERVNLTAYLAPWLMMMMTAAGDEVVVLKHPRWWLRERNIMNAVKKVQFTVSPRFF